MDSRYIFEVLIASLYIALGIVPFAYIRYYPFLDKLRFSKLKTIIMFSLLVLLNIYIFIKIEKNGSFLEIENSGAFRVSFFIVYFIFSCISIKENFFKHCLIYLVCFMFITTLTVTVYFIDRIFHIDIPYLTYVLIMIIFTVPFATLNFLFTKNLDAKSRAEKEQLFDSPTVLFLLSRGKNATDKWSTENLFEEKQNDTADILVVKDGKYEIIDIKTRNISKYAQAPNIISAYKLAQLCAKILDNKDFETFMAAEEIYLGQCSSSEDFKEGITAFLEKRPADFKGK